MRREAVPPAFWIAIGVRLNLDAPRCSVGPILRFLHVSKQLQPTDGTPGPNRCPSDILRGCRDFVALSSILGAIVLLAIAAHPLSSAVAQVAGPQTPNTPSPSTQPLNTRVPAASAPKAAPNANSAQGKPGAGTKSGSSTTSKDKGKPRPFNGPLDVGQAISGAPIYAGGLSVPRMPGISGDAMSVGTVVKTWRFNRQEDADYDGWPEGWQRKRDRDHPPYLPMKLVATDPRLLQSAQTADLRILQAWPFARKAIPQLPGLPPSVADLTVDRHFRIELNGGWAMVQSSPFPIDTLYRYRLELSGKAESLVNNHAFAEMVFLNAAGEAIAPYATNSLRGTTEWTRLETDLVGVPEGAVSVAVRLIVRPMRASGEFDINGAACFDNLLIRRLPQMRISTDHPLAIYDEGQRPTITVRVLGLDRIARDVHFIVRNVAGEEVGSQSVGFEEVVAPSPSESLPAADAAAVSSSEKDKSDRESTVPRVTASAEAGSVASRDAAAPLPDSDLASKELGSTAPASKVTAPSETSSTIPTVEAIEGIATWQLPPLRPGYYVIQSLLGNPERPSLSNETTFVILGDFPLASADNPFGWTLPRSMMEDIEMKRVPDWIHRLGVGVVKLPCWYEPNDQPNLDAAAWLVGRLQDNNIRTIGMLDVPPPSVLAKINERERRDPSAANYFRDAAVWPQLLEPIMTRLSLKVRTWQLGPDDDYSFLGRSPLKQTIKEIGRNLQGFGQPIGVAFSWPWLEPLPPASEQSWAALNLAASTPLAPDELDAYLQSIQPQESSDRDAAETWVSLDPLDAKLYDRQTRIADLVLRMTTVRGHRVPGAFISNPVDPRQGLLRDDWRPSELLLPFRTTSLLVGDLKRVGSLPMLRGSSTVVLANAGRTSIVVWNPTPTTEVIYFGDKVRQVDVWGNAIRPKQVTVDGKPYHEIQVGPMPTFLIDVDPVLVAFRMSAKLVEKSLDSLLNRRQMVTLEFVNPTQDTLSGEVRIRQINDWIVDSRPQAFDLGPARVAKHEFDVSLRNSAKIGPSRLEFEFLLRTTPQRRFTVSREIHVGPEGLDIEVTTRLVEGELLVFLTMVNRTDKPQQYDCMMFPPGGGQYQRRQVIVPAESTVKRLFPWGSGDAMVGQKMLLRAVEQNGDRVLNQVVEITP